MEFSYSQTENFEVEKLSSDTGYFKKPVEINRGIKYISATTHCVKTTVNLLGQYVLSDSCLVVHLISNRMHCAASAGTVRAS